MRGQKLSNVLILLLTCVIMHRLVRLSSAFRTNPSHSCRSRSRFVTFRPMTEASASPEGSDKVETKKKKGGGGGGGKKNPKVKAPTEDELKLTPQGIEDIKQARMAKMELVKAQGVNPFAYNFDQTHKTADLQVACKDLPSGEEDPSMQVAVAGRIMLRRVFGKLAFFTLQDDTGTIQLYLEKGRLEDAFKDLKDQTDAGDIIGVKGTVKRTDKGELSVYASEWTMLTKSLLPLPDKFHGLTDVSKRYRQRHLDMIVNPEVRETFKARAFITASIRRMLDEQGFLEIETPVLHSQPGGAEAKPFETYHNSLEMDLTLRIATELHLKRLVVGGFDRVYEVGRIFRNEGLSTRHNPEFTSVELYQAYADYDDMMQLTESMISKICQDLTGSMIINYQGQEVDLSPPWRRISMNDAVKEKCGVDFYNTYMNPTAAGASDGGGEEGDSSAPLLDAAKTAFRDCAAGKTIGEDLIASATSVGQLLNTAFEELCEADMVQPTFVTDHPVEVSPLAKPHRSKPGLVERFEMFMVGREHANAFSELTDPIDQRERFNQQATKKAQGDEEACGVDEDFLQALETGMPPTAGLGIGIDRLVMALTDSAAIRDVIAFPLLRKEG